MNTTTNFNGDGLSPLAESTSSGSESSISETDKAKRAPTNRDLRAWAREVRSTKQAVVDKSVTATSSGESKKKVHEGKDDTPISQPTRCRRKTIAPVLQPEQHHRDQKESNSHDPSPSLDGDLKSEPSKLHATRVSNIPVLERIKQPKLNVPPPNDPKWKELDKELMSALPLVFPKTEMRSLSSSPATLSKRFAEWLHTFLGERCGEVESTSSPNPNKRVRKNRGLNRK